jgi:hypothetical protein
LTSLFLLTSLVPVWAGTKNFSEPCKQSNYHLSFGNYELNGDCSAALYCAPNQTCANKGCRTQIFPFGYLGGVTLPPLCSNGTFCPDENDQCLPLLSVGSPCQLGRDGRSAASSGTE